MTGLKKYEGKDRRRQRLHNHIAHDLRSPKYRPRVIDRKRIEDEDGNYYFLDRYYDEEDDYGQQP